MNRKFFVLAFVSAAFFFGCSADGFLPSLPQGGLPGAVVPGGPGSSLWCVDHYYEECTNDPTYTSSDQACESWGDELMDTCPLGYDRDEHSGNTAYCRFYESGLDICMDLEDIGSETLCTGAGGTVVYDTSTCDYVY
jgi:hypothetical protein